LFLHEGFGSYDDKGQSSNVDKMPKVDRDSP
jgi:hypothetical protein